MPSDELDDESELVMPELDDVPLSVVDESVLVESVVEVSVLEVVDPLDVDDVSVVVPVLLLDESSSSAAHAVSAPVMMIAVAAIAAKCRRDLATRPARGLRGEVVM